MSSQMRRITSISQQKSENMWGKNVEKNALKKIERKSRKIKWVKMWKAFLRIFSHIFPHSFDFCR